jgi:formylglycine-generating enzyme required for sulfatase activity
VTRRNEIFGQSQGYWCYVRPGAYRIGGSDRIGVGAEHAPIADLTLPAFWIARLPATAAQFAPFVEEGYNTEAERWWTPHGWQWKQERNRNQPWRWDDSAYTSPNQPVIGVTWYEAAAFCAWLSDRLAEALPPGYVIRLPTEAEWEVAAAYDGNGDRRIYPWGSITPTPELAIYDESQVVRTAPVGCCPAGVAACGALDMAGNVWEWATSRYDDYPAASAKVADDFVQSKNFTREEMVVPLRGGSWADNSTYVHCGTRIGSLPDLRDGGFRLVVAPR